MEGVNLTPVSQESLPCEVSGLELRWTIDKIADEARGQGDRAVSIIIEMPAQEIAAIKRLTRLDDDAAAIMQAAREFLRFNKLRELKGASGQVEFGSNWQELEDIELRHHHSA